MKISFITRPNEKTKWGGDLKTIHAIRDGLRALGCAVHLAPSVMDLPASDFVFLTNTCLDLRNDRKIVQLQGMPYGVIGFHEDTIKFFGPAFGFYHYVRSCLDGAVDDGVDFSIEALFENPHLIHYYAMPPRKSNLVNYEVLKDAKVCIANTETEAKTMLRDCPSCNAQVVPWAPGFAEDFEREATGEFLALTGLKSREYILQVGRFELRKNQLGTILATKDLDLPLVFIATKGSYEWYEAACMEAIQKWRKGPTLILSQTLPEGQSGSLRVLPMPGREKLSTSMLQSAFAHAGLHLHPAFYELPGATYFESAILGVPTIASTWTTIDEYFLDPKLDERIEYSLPYDLPRLTQLVHKKLGQTFPLEPLHPIFRRTKVDVAKEILRSIQC